MPWPNTVYKRRKAEIEVVPVHRILTIQSSDVDRGLSVDTRVVEGQIAAVKAEAEIRNWCVGAYIRLDTPHAVDIPQGSDCVIAPCGYQQF